MEQLVSKHNYIGTKFNCSNIKQFKKDLLSRKGMLKAYSISFFAKDNVIKTYYDTDDLFFQNNGINININRFNGKEAELVVRYSSSAPRLEFISDIPDTFTKLIEKKDYIENHLDFVIQTCQRLKPSGYNVVLDKVVQGIKPQITVAKKRERYRLINAVGFKITVSIDTTEYSSYNSRARAKLPIVEFKLESDREKSREFFNFVHDINLQFPTLTSLPESDLTVAQNYLNPKGKK